MGKTARKILCLSVITKNTVQQSDLLEGTIPSEYRQWGVMVLTSVLEKCSEVQIA